MLGAMLVCSCNKNNEPDLTVELPINSVFIPVTIDVNTDEIDEQEREEIMNLMNNKHIVNSFSEIPDDPIGHNEALYNVDYNEETVLIMYLFKKWTIDTYSSRFYRDTKENSYNWVVKIGTTAEFEDNPVVQLTRFAIAVRKLPPGANVQTWYSLTQLGL